MNRTPVFAFGERRSTTEPSTRLGLPLNNPVTRSHSWRVSTLPVTPSGFDVSFTTGWHGDGHAPVSPPMISQTSPKFGMVGRERFELSHPFRECDLQSHVANRIYLLPIKHRELTYAHNYTEHTSCCGENTKSVLKQKPPALFPAPLRA